MKTFKLIIIIFCMLSAFACNSKQNKTAKKDSNEGVKPTSEIINSKKPAPTVQKELTPCDSIVTEILTTTPRYRQLTKGLNEAVIKNGGLSFGVRLEGSPNHNHEKALSYSKTYDFTVYEMYTDRKLNTARFSFNPTNKQLYEYDAAQDQLNPIEFDKNLLVNFEALCH